MLQTVQTLARNKVRFTADEYSRMLDAGLLGDGRCELIEGRIRKMAAQKDPHMWAVTRGSLALSRRFPAETHSVIIQGTLWLDRFNVPDPDLQVYDVPLGTPLAGRMPIVVIEVSHTSYARDSGVKLRRYAANGVADYWIVNLPADRVEVYRNPLNPTGVRKDWRYDAPIVVTRGSVTAMLARPDVSIAAEELLG